MTVWKIPGQPDPVPKWQIPESPAVQRSEVNGNILAYGQETTVYDDTELSNQAATNAGKINEHETKLSEHDAQLAENVKFSKQTDFVELVSRLAEYDEMYYKRENTPGWLTIMLKKGNEHISWSFRNNTYDDFMILGDCFVGSVTSSLQVYQNKNYDSLTGTWATTAPNAHYTMQVGATFTTVVQGEKIEFIHYANNQGGIWEFVVDGDTNKKVTVSTYSATALAPAYKTIFENLPYGDHTVVGTFKGDDPANVPSGGAGTSRGWVWYNATTTPNTFRGYKTQLTNNRDNDLLFPSSNKEFAIKMRKSGVGTHQFVPMHSAIGTAFEAEPEKVIVDGTLIDTTTLTIAEFIPCSEFKLIQKIYARNPDAGTENLALIDTNVTITKKGLVEVLGKMKTLTAIDITDGYGIMFPASKPVVSRLLTSIGNEYAATKTDGSRTSMIAEKDKTEGYAFTSETDKNYIMAVRLNDVKNTLRTGQSGKYSEGNTAWIEHRDATLTKVYNSVFYNTTLPAGFVFKFGGTFCSAKVTNIHDVI